jgi:hypothetical protein
MEETVACSEMISVMFIEGGIKSWVLGDDFSGAGSG